MAGKHALPYDPARDTDPDVSGQSAHPVIALSMRPVSARMHVASNNTHLSPRFTPADSVGDLWDTRGRTL